MFALRLRRTTRARDPSRERDRGSGYKGFLRFALEFSIEAVLPKAAYAWASGLRSTCKDPAYTDPFRITLYGQSPN